ncbi:hypothetical protein RSAG8_11078, partial [Rhizoctonia solani AG-8 WAC10335]
VTLSYADKVTCSKHEGSETGGSRHEFVLSNGEYITEMLIWESDWVHGLQFMTNFGRCSPDMGGSWNKPTVARSIKGGVLVGIVSVIKPHEPGRLFRDIQGIWRHDIIDKTPKEDDVFSRYFGSKKGMPFNDRTIVRNSDMAISRIELGCGEVIDSLQLTYIDNAGQGQAYQTERHGGPGGSKKHFMLESGEHIVTVVGKYAAGQITQMTFVTDKFRSSEVFGLGISTGQSYSFSVSSPKDRNGKHMRLQYVCGKSDEFLSGIMFVWTPM